MNITENLARISNAKNGIKRALRDKGISVNDSALLDEYPALIDSIGLVNVYKDLYDLRTYNGTNMKGLFYYYNNPELDLSGLDVSQAKDISYMFAYCSSSVNINGWNTSNVTNMESMFWNFSGSVDVSKLDTSNVTNVSNMFNYANTDNIILTGLSFPSATSLSYMFNSAKGTILDLSSWDISNIKNMNNMFNGNLEKIDLTGWDTNKVTDMGYMFNQYNNPLKELIIPDWDMTNVTSSSNFMSPSYMTKLKLIDLSRSNDLTITKIASFLPTRTVTTFGTVLVPYDTSQEAYDALVAKYWAPIGAAMAPVLTSIEIVAELDEIMPGDSTKVFIGACEPWNADPSKVELVLVSDSSIATMDGNEVTSTGVLGDIVLEARIKDTQEVIGTKTIAVSETDSYPNIIKFRGTSTPNSNNYILVNGTSSSNRVLLSKMDYNAVSGIYTYDVGEPIISIRFNGYGGTSIGGNTCTEVVKVNTSNMTSMEKMCNDCPLLTFVNAEKWDTSKVTNMAYMFSGCNELQYLNLSNFDMTNVINSNNMIDIGRKKLHTIRLDNCNNTTISKIINSSGFPTNTIEGVTRTIYCKGANAAGLATPINWEFNFIDGVTPEILLYVPGQFREIESVGKVETIVNESHTDLSYMFYGCSNLISVNTEDWDTSNVTTMTMMFKNCHSLTSLDLSNWDMSNVTSVGNMFSDCDSLHTLHLDNCSYDTINKIITSYNFPTNVIEGVTRTIYCKEENAAGLTAPTNWVFSYVD